MPNLAESLVELHPVVYARDFCRDADEVIYQDVFVDDCYRVCDLPAEIKTVVDVGAHIGCFALKVRQRFPEAEIVCVEADEANLATLIANTGGKLNRCRVPRAAGYYRHARVYSTVFRGSDNSGGSFVLSADEQPREVDDRYRPSNELVETITLEAIVAKEGWDSIDLLKLDCEGSEFDILAHCDKSLLQTVVGEWHDRVRFMALVKERFADFTLDVLRDGELGVFRLSRPGWWL